MLILDDKAQGKKRLTLHLSLVSYTRKVTKVASN